MGRPKKDTLTQLQSKEANAVLQELLQRHPELQSETEAIAGKVIFQRRLLYHRIQSCRTEARRAISR